MKQTLSSALFTAIFLVIVNKASVVSQKPPETTSASIPCRYKRADVDFLLDVSLSLSKKEFKELTTTIKDIVTNFDLGAKKTRVGITMFTNKTYTHVQHFANGFNMSNVLQVIQNLKTMRGIRTTVKALQLVRHHDFYPLSDHTWAEMILVVFTDGISGDSSQVSKEVKLLQKSGVKIFVVGIGSGVDLKQMQKMASQPSSEFVHKVNSFDILKKQSILLINKIKHACTAWKYDIDFLLDVSSSLTTDEFAILSNTLERIVKTLVLGAMGTRVGISMFSNNKYTHVQHFNTGTIKPNVLHVIQNLKTMRGMRTTVKALQLVRHHDFYPLSDHTWAEKILVVFTDGISGDSSQVSKEVKFLQKSGVKIFVVGIGSGVDLKQMQQMASQPSSEFLHEFDSFDILQKQSNRLANNLDNQAFANDQNVCKRADVDFVLDFSSGLPIEKFKKLRNTIHNIVNNFDIGAKKIQVGMTIFTENEYTHVLHHSNGYKKQKALQVIRNIKHIGRGSTTLKALQYVRSHVFFPPSYHVGAERIAILFTDGISGDFSQILRQVKFLRKNGIKIFMVGIGDAVDKQKVKDIASQPTSEFVHIFASLDILQRHSNLLIKKVYNQASPNDQNACDETQLTDVVFMVSSNRFDQRKIDRILKASVAVIKKVGRNGAFRYGIIFDDCLKTQDLAVGEFTEKSQLTSEVAKCQNTSLASLIKKLKPDIFLPRRTNNPHQFGLLFLDNTIDLKDPEIQKQSRRAIFMDLKLFVVIIGDGVSKRRVKHSLAPKELIINVDSYENLPLDLSVMFSQIFCVTRPMEKIHEPAIL